MSTVTTLGRSTLSGSVHELKETTERFLNELVKLGHFEFGRAATALQKKTSAFLVILVLTFLAAGWASIALSIWLAKSWGLAGGALFSAALLAIIATTMFIMISYPDESAETEEGIPPALQRSELVHKLEAAESDLATASDAVKEAAIDKLQALNPMTPIKKSIADHPFTYFMGGIAIGALLSNARTHRSHRNKKIGNNTYKKDHGQVGEMSRIQT